MRILYLNVSKIYKNLQALFRAILGQSIKIYCISRFSDFNGNKYPQFSPSVILFILMIRNTGCKKGNKTMEPYFHLKGTYKTRAEASAVRVDIEMFVDEAGSTILQKGVPAGK